MSIKQLPEDVAAQIKSSVVIVSLNSVVYGLSKNSLDAGASKLNVSVDYRRGNCTVEDDGQGIPPSDFQKDGLGKLYCKSLFPLLVREFPLTCVQTLPSTRLAPAAMGDMAPFWHQLQPCRS